MSVFVLWEDRAVGPVARFGPHIFLVACVASRLGVDRYKLARAQAIDGKPCAGNGNLLRELRREPLWDSGVHVVAVLDTDELHDRLPGVASRRQVVDAEYPRWSDAVILQRAAGDESTVEKACAEMPSWDHLVTTVARRMGRAVG